MCDICYVCAMYVQKLELSGQIGRFLRNFFQLLHCLLRLIEHPLLHETHELHGC